MKKKSVFSLIIIFLIVILLLIIKFMLLRDDNIKHIAYNVNKTNYKIYLKENNKYVPYLVLDNNYNGTNSTLIIRENILGGESYTYDYNGSISEEKIYNKSLLMNQYFNYDETDVDKFLVNEFVHYFDDGFINIINDTEVSVENVEMINNENYKIKRKFFILSIGELGLENVANQNDQNSIDYFKNNGLIAKNDGNENANYWTRSYSYGLGGYSAIGYSGALISVSGTEAKYGIRPAFTISGKTKIKKQYISQIGKEVLIIDY